MDTRGLPAGPLSLEVGMADHRDSFCPLCGFILQSDLGGSNTNRCKWG